jgi:hypothetical protein
MLLLCKIAGSRWARGSGLHNPSMHTPAPTLPINGAGIHTNNSPFDEDQFRSKTRAHATTDEFNEGFASSVSQTKSY